MASVRKEERNPNDAHPQALEARLLWESGWQPPRIAAELGLELPVVNRCIEVMRWWPT